MITITLFAPTPLILGAFALKGITHDLGVVRNALPDVPGPSLEFQDTVVVGEAAILGWLDRRYPVPALFPLPLDLYSKAATLAHALGETPSLADTILKAHVKGPRRTPFLFGMQPTIADLALWRGLKDENHPHADAWAAHLFAGATP